MLVGANLFAWGKRYFIWNGFLKAAEAAPTDLVAGKARISLFWWSRKTSIRFYEFIFYGLSLKKVFSYSLILIENSDSYKVPYEQNSMEKMVYAMMAS